MIITVTLNPALDKTLIIDDFKQGVVNREKGIRIDAAGKGINVSKAIKAIGGKTLATGFLSGNAGIFIKNDLEHNKISNDFIFANGETRTNTKIVDKSTNLVTDINENGPIIANSYFSELEDKIDQLASSDTVFVFSGSIPPNADKHIYRRLIEKVNSKNAKAVLDADKEILKYGINAIPYAVKPNLFELQNLFGCVLRNIDDIVCCGSNILDYGVQVVVISLGDKGSIFITKKKIIYVECINVNVISTVGAGDSMAAAVAYSVENGYPIVRMATLASAMSTACVMMPGTQFAEWEQVKNLKKKVKLNETSIY